MNYSLMFSKYEIYKTIVDKEINAFNEFKHYFQKDYIKKQSEFTKINEEYNELYFKLSNLGRDIIAQLYNKGERWSKYQDPWEIVAGILSDLLIGKYGEDMIPYAKKFESIYYDFIKIQNKRNKLFDEIIRHKKAPLSIIASFYHSDIDYVEWIIRFIISDVFINLFNIMENNQINEFVESDEGIILKPKYQLDEEGQLIFNDFIKYGNRIQDYFDKLHTINDFDAASKLFYSHLEQHMNKFVSNLKNDYEPVIGIYVEKIKQKV